MPAITTVSSVDANHGSHRSTHWATVVWESFSRSSSLWAFDILCLPGFYEAVPDSIASPPNHAHAE